MHRTITLGIIGFASIVVGIGTGGCAAPEEEEVASSDSALDESV